MVSLVRYVIPQSKLFVTCQVISSRVAIRRSKSDFSPVSVYILSAVRTPVGVLNGVLNTFSAPQLGSCTFREALQRAVVPCKDFQNVFLGCDSQNNSINEIINRTGLPRMVKVLPVSLYGMKSFIEAIRSLVMNNEMVCLAGGIDSTSNLSSVVHKEYLGYIERMQENISSMLKDNLLSLDALIKYTEKDYKNFFEAHKNELFFDEIIKIDFIRKGQKINVEEDEVANLNFFVKENSELVYLPPFADGAVGIVISTEDYIKKNPLSPLAKIISFAEESSKEIDFATAQSLAIEKALKLGNCQCDEISRWEIDSAFGVVFNRLNHLKIDPSLVNKDGGVFSLGYPVGMSGMKAVCHLTHSLADGELGCAVSCDLDGSASAVIIKKLHSSMSGKPQLTLFTKRVCPLCEELKDELKAFQGRFSLKEVDIEAEENKNYYDLFKYEIPVLFLDGRFLCKHKLNARHLNRRLAAYEKAT